MKERAPLLEKISVERIFIEFDKLLTADFWRKGLEKLIASEAYQYLPDLQDKGACLQTLLDRLNPDFRFQSSEQAWTMLIIALEEKEGKTFLKKWKTSNDFQKAVSNLVSAYRSREQASADCFLTYQYGLETLSLVEELRQAQGLSVEIEEIKALDAALPIHDKHEMVVNGGTLIQELGLKPGPELGRILQLVEEAIVSGNLSNEKEAIFTFLEKKGLL